MDIRQGSLGQLLVGVIVLIHTGCEVAYHMHSRTLRLLALNVVSKVIFQHDVKRAALARCNLSQRRQHFRRGLGRKPFPGKIPKKDESNDTQIG
jgi:hypothetical protein